MSDEYDDEYDDEQQEPQERTSSEWARLRRAEKAADKAKKELEAIKAEQAFFKAGLNPDDPKVKYFRKGYEGDLTPEAIKAEALAAGFLSAEEPPIDEAPIEATARIAAAASGIGETPMELAVAEVDKAYANGGADGLLAHLSTLGIPVRGAQ